MAAAALVGGLSWWSYGTPFDGWSRADERHVHRICLENAGATDRFCECFVDELQQEGVAFEEVDAGTGQSAGFVCGAFLRF